MRALLIRHPWIDLILEGEKSWEIRGSRTLVRGMIGLIPSGCLWTPSNPRSIIGVCELVGCVGPLTAEEFYNNAKKAGVRPEDASVGWYQKTYAWVLEKPRILKRPVPYQHPSGAIIWVTLNDEIEQEIRKQL